MRPISLKNRKIISESDYYKVCSRQDCNCDGRITIEHSFIYAGKQIDDLWSLIPLCWRHHLGDLLDKELNHYIALKRAIELEGSLLPIIKKYPKKNWVQMFKYLCQKYE